MSLKQQRCSWAVNDLLIAYHDEEYGRLAQEDRDIFEKICLESFQAGLSWYIVLKKRPALRKAFAQFDIGFCSRLSDRDLEDALSGDIIQNRRKVAAVRSNALAALRIIEEKGSLIALIQTCRTGDELAAALKAYGMRQIGPVGAEELLKSLGLLPAHEEGCFLAAREGEGGCPRS